MEYILPILIACIGSTGLWSLISFLIQRSDKKKDKTEVLHSQMNDMQSKMSELGDVIKTQTDTIASVQQETKDLKDVFLDDREVYMKERNEQEKDSLRIQMLIMINHYPLNKDNILQLAEKYFVECGGNWYMRDVFMEWADKYNVHVPFDVK